MLQTEFIRLGPFGLWRNSDAALEKSGDFPGGFTVTRHSVHLSSRLSGVPRGTVHDPERGDWQRQTAIDVIGQTGMDPRNKRARERPIAGFVWTRVAGKSAFPAA
jgi:hypothetical protein